VISYNIGGGIHFNQTFGTVVETQISHNSYGSNISGAVYCVNSYPSLYYCTIADNNMPGVRMIESGSTIYSCGIMANNDSGIYSTDNSSFKMYNSTVMGNSGFMGGGIACLFGSSPEIYNSYIIGNRASFMGGGIFLYDDSSPYIEDSYIMANSSMRGCGIYCENSSPHIRGCEIGGNSNIGDDSSGGGIYSRGESEFVLESSLVSQNKANYGGGVHCYSNDSMIISNCLLTANIAVFYGGAVHCVDSETSITNCTIVNNESGISEAGVSIASGHVTIMNSILWSNAGSSIGGNVPGDVVYNCIEEGYIGEGNIHDNPLFVTGPWGEYYLSNESSGQAETSPCVNAGNPVVPAYDFMPEWKTTRTDGIFDTDTVDIGYHYQPHIWFGLDKTPVKDSYVAGDTLKLLESVKTAYNAFGMDIYFIMEDPTGALYYGLNWSINYHAALEGLIIFGGESLEDVSIMTISIPNENPPIMAPGDYTFSMYATKPGTDDLISEVAEVNFTVE
jgi:hypothetical protein